MPWNRTPSVNLLYFAMYNFLPHIMHVRIFGPNFQEKNLSSNFLFQFFNLRIFRYLFFCIIKEFYYLFLNICILLLLSRVTLVTQKHK